MEAFKMAVGIVIVIGLIIGAIFLSGFIANIVGFAISLVIWSLTGYFAGKLVRGRGYGLLGNVVMGIIGGIGGSLFLGILGWGHIAAIPVLGGVIGAIIVVLVVRTFFDGQFAK